MAKKCAAVHEEGPEDKLFSKSFHKKMTNNPTELTDNIVDELDPVMVKHTNKRKCHEEDIHPIRSLGLDVNDDNDPAPENVPTTAEEDDDNGNAPLNVCWHKDSICQQKKDNAGMREPSLNHKKACVTGASVEKCSICSFQCHSSKRLFKRQAIN